jgi:Protein of unknown function (DUF2628)
MRVYTAHTPPAAIAPGAGPLLLRDGFAWGACLFGGLWLLARRLWWEALAWAGAAAVLVALLPGWALPPVALTAALLLGWHGQDLRRAALARRGWTLAEIVAARDTEAALARLLDARPDLLAGAPMAAA